MVFPGATHLAALGACPWSAKTNQGALKVRNIVDVIPLFQSSMVHDGFFQGRRTSLRSVLPLAIIFRAFGAARSKEKF
jgi:hypothetical protein